MPNINGYLVSTNCLDAPVQIEEIRDTDEDLIILFDKPFTFALWFNKKEKEILIDILNGA